MCKAVNVKHLGKKIIGVYTVHYDWSALKMWFQLTHYFQYWNDNVMTGSQEKYIFSWGWEKFTWKRWTLLQDLCLDIWDDIAHESIKD